MDVKKINKEIIKKYLNDNNDSNINFKSFLGLYSNYYKLSQIISKNENNNILKQYEERIYTINNHTMNDIERIIVEINKIKLEIRKLRDNENIEEIKEELDKIEDLLKTNTETVNGFVDYIKKKITKIQVFLDMDITFYDAAYNLFLNEYTKLEDNYGQVLKRN